MTSTELVSEGGQGDSVMSDVVAYGRLGGALLVLGGLGGLVAIGLGRSVLGGGLLHVSQAVSGVHLASGAVLLAIGLAKVEAATRRLVARSLGLGYLALAVLGFLSPTLFGLGTQLGHTLGLAENLAHLLVGAWGAYAGSAKR